MCAGGAGGSAWLTWPSHRRRAGAELLRAIQRRVRCSQVFKQLRETGCSLRRPIRYGGGGGRARYGGYATWCRGIVLSCTHCAEREGVAGPTGRGWGCRAGMTGSTTEVAPCPNISPGWACPWAREERRWAGPATALAKNWGRGVPVEGGRGFRSRCLPAQLTWLLPMQHWHPSRTPACTRTVPPCAPRPYGSP